MDNLTTISFNFKKAKKQANELDRIAEEMKNLANRDLSGSLSGLSSGWSGDSANLFINKGGNLKEDILKTASQLAAAADVLRRTAQAVYNAEMRAEMLARQRSSGGGGAGGGGGGSR